MNDWSQTPPPLFELLVHLLELSVVIGIGVIIYITKKYPVKGKGKIDESGD